ncbi:hypothetical protein EMIHUDRAFT_205977 [Emiliania huxleyi CCMP1516]|uniref:Pentacotripeptide-repeat region of PRORP domain-containing protein n=2 Tax=Emiliania huxleyi TaxID=2903 RepID=A0A0D3JQN5_EMIH1|nr:hypothetical protein EMIHUDRAFT_205977 [Emiliania huxleyi CCMP1516]EOD25820.1 hypothetical protein EMIHUDRAFT_205977 [Emiliania huxleyi CCMP1516]|eukprot:XP_005778249.1 hypothetical protein EMIHUDRAFT_205977 [Emiliania huxleyi CCMP1516]
METTAAITKQFCKDALVCLAAADDTASGESVEAVALSVVQACSAAGLAPTREMFNHLLVAIAAKGPPSAVLDWFGRARSAGIGVGTIACNLVIAAHVAQGDVKTAAELLTLMMRGEAARGGLPPPNAVTFNTVISAFARACDPQKAELTLVAMIDSGLVPAGPASYASVIAAWARAAQPATAERWLSRMLSSCVPLAGTAASEVVAFNATLDAFAKASDVSGARRVLDLFRTRADSTPGLPMRRELERAGLQPNTISFSAVIHAHANAGDAAKAQGWLDSMRARGVPADAVCFNSVCAAHARRGDVASASVCFRAMEEAGVCASPQTHAILVHALAACFNSLISLFARQRQPLRAEGVLALMREARVRPTLVTLNALASAHASVGDMDATERILGQATTAFRFSLDHYSFAALFQAARRVAINTHLAELARNLPGTSPQAQLRAEYDASRAKASAAVTARQRQPGLSDAAAFPTRCTLACRVPSLKTIAKPPPPKASPRRPSRARPRLPPTPALPSETPEGEAANTVGSASFSEDVADAEAEAAEPPPVRAVGASLSRSKSERSRLLALAEGVARSEQLLDGGAPQPVPLRRSAASQLALDLTDQVSL